MDSFNQTMTQLSASISPWVYAPVVFLIWIILLSAIKGIVFSRLEKIAERTKLRFDDIAIQSARFPVTLLILATGAYLLKLLLPLNPKTTQGISVLIQAVILMSIVFFIDQCIKSLGNMLSERRTLAFASHGIVQGILRGGIVGLGILIFLDMIGISITPLLASLGIGSLAVALGLQETLTNFFAGIYITLDRPIQVGDFVKLESGEEGYVIEVGWRSTRIRMLPNNIVIVPNQKLMGTTITNYYLPSPDLAVLVNVGVHYDSGLKKVEQATIEVGRHIMKTVQGGVPDFDPFIRYHTFNDSSIDFTVILRAREFVDQYLIKHEFIKTLHERYKREGIVIPFPMRTLHIPEETLASLKERS